MPDPTYSRIEAFRDESMPWASLRQALAYLSFVEKCEHMEQLHSQTEARRLAREQDPKTPDGDPNA